MDTAGAEGCFSRSPATRSSGVRTTHLTLEFRIRPTRNLQTSFRESKLFIDQCSIPGHLECVVDGDVCGTTVLHGYEHMGYRHREVVRLISCSQEPLTISRRIGSQTDEESASPHHRWPGRSLREAPAFALIFPGGLSDGFDGGRNGLPTVGEVRWGLPAGRLLRASRKSQDCD